MAGERRLVGREAELEQLAALLRRPEALPRVAVLLGEAGIGKTSVLDAAIAAAPGYRVLRSRAAETESSLAFVGLGDLLADAGAAIAGLPGVQRRALERALLLVDGEEEGGAPPDARAIGLGLLGCLRELAADGAVLVAVDDLQWLDGASLAALRFALARLDDEPVAVLLATRGEAPRWVPEARTTVVELGGLSVGALHDLLRTRLERPPARPALLRIREASGGNPFFALELARALARRGGGLAPDGTLPLPAALGELLAERLAELPPEASAVALAVAALGEPEPRVLAEVVPEPEPGLAAASAAGVLELAGGRVRFAHPLLASAVPALAAPEERRRLHARCAAVVADPERRARHLALAATGPDADVAGALDDAARRARGRGAPSAGAELAGLALRLTPLADDGALRRRTIETATMLREAGDGGAAVELLERALAEAPAGTRAPLLGSLAATQLERAGPRASIPLYRAALAEAGGDAATEAAAHFGLAECFRFADDLSAAEPHALAAVELAERTGDAPLLAQALATSALIRFGRGHGFRRATIERAVALERREAPHAFAYEPRLVLGHLLFWSNELNQAREVLEELLHTVDEADDPAANPAWYLALVEWRAGAWPAARAYAEQALERDRLAGKGGLRPIGEWPLALVEAHCGELDSAVARSRAALGTATAGGIDIARASHLWVLGFAAFSAGDTVEALRRLREAQRLRTRVGLIEPGQRVELPDLLDVLLAAGELAEAEALLDEWEEHARRLDRPWALAIAGRHRGVLLAARGDLDGAAERLRSALADHAHASDPFQEARTRLALGVTLRRAKRRADARATLGEALTALERLGAPRWAERARAELGRIGGRTPTGTELTEAERRVVEHVAAGRTNRETAAALYITEHTVEKALTRAYRKLGVRSRAELAARLSADG